ncbi:MAG: 4Fe-4S binding protein, partial [Polyangia bacterium]|nr:4Fe-4S binding protein [Polyangia bacterium]
SGAPTSLPVDPEALRAADRAGVELRCGLAPSELIGGRAGTRGVRFQTQAFEEGERAGRPSVKAGVAVELAADLVVDATARVPDLEGWPSADRTPWGTLAVSSADLRTSQGLVFGAGEVVTGARSVIDAVAHGRRAAALVGQALSAETASKTPAALNALAARHASLASAPRQLRLNLEGAPRQESAWVHVPTGPRAARALPLGLEGVPDGGPIGRVEPLGQAEARRCRRCGPCAECASCSPYCGETVSVDPVGAWVRFPGGASLPSSAPLTPIRAWVEEVLCNGCGLCEERCPYAAPRVTLRPVAAGGRALVARVDPGACRGCGLCVGLCPTGALLQGGFASGPLMARIDDALGGEVQ